MDLYERLKKTLTVVGLMEYLPAFEENELTDEMMDTMMADLKLKKEYFAEIVPKMAHRIKIEIEFKRVTTLQIEGIVIIKEEKSSSSTPSRNSTVPPKGKSESKFAIPKTEQLELQPSTSSVPNSCPASGPNPLESTVDTKGSLGLDESQNLDLHSEDKDENNITIKYESMDYGCEDENLDPPGSTSSVINEEHVGQDERQNSLSGVEQMETDDGTEVGRPVNDSRTDPPSTWNCVQDKNLHSNNPCYIHFPNDGTSDENTYRIGFFRLILLSTNGQNPNVLLPDLSQFILHVNDDPRPSVILLKVKRPNPLVKIKIKNGRKLRVLNSFKHYYFPVNILDVNPDFLSYGGLGSKKTFDLRFESQNGNEIKVGVNFLNSAIIGQHWLEDIQPCPTSALLPRVFDFFFGIQSTLRTEVGDNDIEHLDNLSSFYRQIRLYHEENQNKSKFGVFPDVQHPLMIPTLRKYQSDAVRWMMVREGFVSIKNESKLLSGEEQTIDKLMKNIYYPIKLKKTRGGSEEVSAFYNHLIGFVSTAKPIKPSVPTGGILGDETGLGKTLEVLALILTHRYNPQQNSLKKLKLENVKRTPIKTTLIVSPWSISHQWMDEIQRHIRGSGLKVLEYKGAGVHKLNSAQLGVFDVVLTTYNVLAKELNFLDLPHLIRNGSTHGDEGLETSCLMKVKWWRICLDEAQMVEGISTKMSIMAKKLKAVHRWCVTGTPINKSINDLFGLISFLKVRPICVKPFWDLMIRRAFADSADLNPTVYGTIGRFLWRNEKINVQNELGLPPQTQVVHWLDFTVPEKYAYNQVYAECKKDFEGKLNILVRSKSEDIKNMPLLSLNKTVVKTVLRPLIRLRKECCDPEYKAELRSIHKGFLSFEKTVDYHIKSNKDSFTEAHHFALAHLNDVGDFYKLKKEWVEARDSYKKVIEMGAEAKNIQGFDSLQVLHGMGNLSEILSKVAHDPGEISELSLLISKLVEEYKNRHRKQVLEAQSQMTKLSLSVEKCVVHLRAGGSPSWWEEILSSLNQSSVQLEQFWSGTQDGVRVSRGRDKKLISQIFTTRSIPCLKNFIQKRLIELRKSREKALDIISSFCTKSPEAFVEESKLCHLGIKHKRSTTEVRTQCSSCKSLVIEIDRYEKLLLSDGYRSSILHNNVSSTLRMKRQLDLEEAIYAPDHVDLEAEHLRSQQQHRRNSGVAQILEAILRFANKVSTPQHILNQGKIQIEFFAAMRQEFWEIVHVRQTISNNVGALYELEVHKNVISKKPSTLGNSNFIKNKMNMHLKWKMDARKYLTRFKSWKLKVEQVHEANSNSLCCPICKSTQITHLCFLPCAHFFCSKNCLEKVYPNKNGTNYLTCPLCEDSLKFQDISYVNTSTRTNDPETLRIIRGEYSSKIDGIVRTLLQLKESHSGEKIIIFSEWDDVLKCIGLALNQNRIGYSMLCDQKSFEKELKRFKQVEWIQVLLMTIGSGSKGLNIVEATHVFLVEPTLHQANELQAIARIHRIGQTKPTFVHRFLIRGSVEDKLYQMFKHQSPQLKEVLVKDLENIIEPVHLH